MTFDEVVDHAASIVAATELPVSADFENGFADEPDAVAANVQIMAATGLAGLSIEDYTGRQDHPIYDLGLASERIAAACEATGNEGPGVVVTARAENHLRGKPDLDDTITRLQAYAGAGAHAVYAPGLTSIDDIRRVVESVDCPLNVLALPGVPTVADLAAAGVARISVGGGFSLVALSAVTAAARRAPRRGHLRVLGPGHRAGARSPGPRAALTALPVPGALTPMTRARAGVQSSSAALRASPISTGMVHSSGGRWCSRAQASVSGSLPAMANRSPPSRGCWR